MSSDDKNIRVTIAIIDETSRLERVLTSAEPLRIGRMDSPGKQARPLLETEAERLAVPRQEYRTRSADVSEQHADLWLEPDGRVIIKDLGSTNGTLVRLLPYRDHELRPGDEVLIGRKLLVVRPGSLEENIPEPGTFKSAEDFAAHIRQRLKADESEVGLVSADKPEPQPIHGACVRIPLPAYGVYLQVTRKKETCDLFLERWLKLNALVFNSGSACVPLAVHDSRPWQFLAASVPRRQVHQVARQIAITNGPVVIIGSTGVGKEVLANDIHNHSAREGKTFLEFNCAGLPPNRAEAELFGWEKWAFTDAHEAHPGLFEQAEGGTLFLDEVAELSLENQAKLLRVLQFKRVRRLGATFDRSVNVRVIAATNKDLQAMVARQEFREDLWFRLEGVQLHIPDLHRADILALVPVLLEDVWSEIRKPDPHQGGKPALPPLELEQLSMLASVRDWPGGARQLRNALGRYLIFRDEGRSVEANWQACLSNKQEAAPEPKPSGKQDALLSAATGDPGIPVDAMSTITQLDKLLTLTIAREVLSVQRRGAWAELGRRLGLTGAGAQDKIRRLLKLDENTSQLPAERYLELIDRAIDEVRQQLKPNLGFLRTLMQL